MSYKSAALALVAGIVAFLVVGVGVTELAQPRIAFSLFVGIPAGIVAGAFAASAVYVGTADSSRQSRLVAGTIAAFGAAFLLSMLVLGLVGNVGIVLSMPVSIVVALVASGAVYVRGRDGEDRGQSPPEGSADVRDESTR